MALVAIEDIRLTSPNPAPLDSPLILEIIFECYAPLEDGKKNK